MNLNYLIPKNITHDEIDTLISRWPEKLKNQVSIDEGLTPEQRYQDILKVIMTNKYPPLVDSYLINEVKPLIGF